MTTTPIPPMPRDPADAIRWEHTRLRRRLLYGAWREDLDRRIALAVGAMRREAWGIPDLSSNVFRSAVSSLAVLYDRRGKIWNEDEFSSVQMARVAANAGFWPLMQRVQRDTLGLREMFLRIDVFPPTSPDGAPEVVYRPVPPDMVVAEGSPENPDEPIEFKELRLRHDAQGRPRWTWDYFCVEADEEPEYKILSAGENAGEDLSAEYLGIPGGLVGDAYPYRYRDGRPFLPVVLYHAAKTGLLFDPFEASELVEGSLNVAVLWTFFGHTVRSASWPQRYAVGVRVPSASVGGDTETTIRESVVSDPSTVLLFEPSEEGIVPQISQWASGADPETLQAAIGMYERRIAAFAGLSPADVQRVAGDPRSGFALAISREGAREAQKRFEPVFQPVDEELFGKTAAMINRATGSTLAEYGYRISYESLPPSAEERQGEREHILGLIGAGLLDRVEAYRMLHPGISRADAEAALTEIAATNARFRAV